MQRLRDAGLIAKCFFHLKRPPVVLPHLSVVASTGMDVADVAERASDEALVSEHLTFAETLLVIVQGLHEVGFHVMDVADVA